MRAVMQSSGRIVSVSKSYAGAELNGGHGSGATELTVTDAGEFFDNGGSLLIDGDTLAYTGIAGDDDEATTTILLASPTSSSYSDGERVQVLPLTPTVIAQVVREGEGASEPAVVWHVLEPFLPLGIRDPNDQEYALLQTDREGDGWMVTNVRGKTPLIDGSALPSSGGDIDPAVADWGPIDLANPDGWVIKSGDGTITYSPDRPVLPLNDGLNFLNYFEVADNPGEYIARHDGTWVDTHSTDPLINVHAYWDLPAPVVTSPLGNRVTMEAKPRTGDDFFGVVVWSVEDDPDGTNANYDNEYWFDSYADGLAADTWVGMTVLLDPDNISDNVLWSPTGKSKNIFYFENGGFLESYIRNFVIRRGVAT